MGDKTRKPWESPDLCGCMSHGCGPCCFAVCCSACARGVIAQKSKSVICAGRYPEACILYMVCYPCIPCMRFYDRDEIKKERGLLGSECGNCAAATCCSTCANVQEYIEVTEGKTDFGTRMKAPKYQQLSR